MWLEGLLLVWRAVGQLNHNQLGSWFLVRSCRQPKTNKQTNKQTNKHIGKELHKRLTANV